MGKPDGTLTWNGEQLATRHIQTYPATSSEQQPVVSELCVIRGTTDNAPNNSCILSFGNSQSWFGQLCIIDNADQGIWRRGTSDGVMGDWYRLLDQQICKSYVTETYVSGTNWYRKYSDGWIEQGGYIIGNGHAVVTSTFNISFTQIPTVIKQTGYSGHYDAVWNWSYAQVWNVTTTSFTHYVYTNAGGGSCRWYACGY